MLFSKDIYKDEKAPAYALLVTTLRKYGMEALEWEPEFLRHDIEDQYGITMSDLQHNKLQAAMTVMITDHFQHDWRVFEVCCHLFNNQNIDAEDLCLLEAEEIAAA